MANASLEQMIQKEQQRVARGGMRIGIVPGLLDLVHPTGAQPKPMAQPVLSERTTAAPNAVPMSSASQINKGNAPAAAPPAQSSTPAASTGGGLASDIGKTALKLFSSGLGVMPLISGLAGLFGSGASEAPAPLVKYTLPRSIQLTAANSNNGGGFQYADYGQDGTARSYSGSSTANSPALDRSAQPTEPIQPIQPTRSGSATQVVVNVQAMDSRSFLDHSQEIAQAVREAMLNMHALNDVVSEL